MIVPAGSVNVSVYYYIVQDASATSPGEPVTGLLFSDIQTGGSASYTRQGAAATSITLITLVSALAAHSDGGFILVSDTLAPGLYRCDYPDAAFAAGVSQTFCNLVIASANNALAAPILVDMDGSIAQTGDNYARIGAPVGASISADIAGVPTVTEFNARTLASASYFDPTVDTVATVTTLTDKAGFSLASTGLDAITQAATGMIEIAKAIWDRVLTGGTHNITNSSGRKLRQLKDAFVVEEGTAQAGTANTITLAATASTTDNIYNGNRCIIVGGTGISEHGIIIAYNGITKVATVAKNWVITPNNTSDYELNPASVDIETWQQNIVTGDGDWALMAATQTTAQNDLDIITGATGVNLLSATQSSINAIETATVTTLDAKINDIQGATFNVTTDSLEAIRDRGDAAWTTGAGGSDRLLMVDTTIATLASQTSFTLTAGSADDTAYENCTLVAEDVTTANQKSIGMVLSYVGLTKTITLKEALAFTLAVTDKIYILAENSLKSTVANRQLDVTATGAAGIDWANVENPTTALDLSGTDIQLADAVTNVNNPITLPTIPTNWITTTGIAASALNGKGNWNIGKTGYSLTQTFPTNFSAMVISGAGAVDSLTQGYMNSLLTEITAGRIAGNFDIFFENSDAITTKTVDDVGVAGSGLTQQNVRDAMKLTPSVGAPSSGSVDLALDNIESDSNELQTDWADAGRLDVILDARMAEASINTTAGAIDNVTLTATTTTNTDMRGTELAALATVATEARLSELDAATAGKMANQMDIVQNDTTTDIPTSIAALNDIAATEIVSAGAINTLSGAIVNVDLVDVTTANTDMRGTDSANTVVPDPAGTAPTLIEILTTAMTESYAADNVAPSLAQAIFIIKQNLEDFAFAGTTKTVKQIDGTTTAATYTLDDAVNPTSSTRTT